MHELGIAQDLIKSIQQKLKNKGDIEQIKKVYVRLGKSMGVTEDSLRFWFENLSLGTKLEGAFLEVTLIDGRQILVDSAEVE